MGTTKKELITYALTPFSWIYGGIMTVRNKLFDMKVLPQESFDIPVVCVGNLTVGGTGKTPHVEYIVDNLASQYNIAVLSRGYKRKTKGFVLANSKSTPDTIGDEAYQTYQKFGSRVKVAVCEKRTKGIKELLRLFSDLQMIILDDAFQHRFVKPKVNILLSDYNRPVYDDKVLPLGRLRENNSGLSRADIVVVTKCPADLNPISKRLILKNMKLMAFQKLFFSTYRYEYPQPVFPENNPYNLNLYDLDKGDTAMVITGIANPRGFIRHFREYDFKLRIAHFPDHYDFSRNDLELIAKQFKKLKGRRKVIITTEKDAVRLANNPYYPQSLKPFTFYLPINVKMLESVEEGDDLLREIVRKAEEKA